MHTAFARPKKRHHVGIAELPSEWMRSQGDIHLDSETERESSVHESNTEETCKPKTELEHEGQDPQSQW